MTKQHLILRAGHAVIGFRSARRKKEKTRKLSNQAIGQL
jgi:hypothetical protein